MAAGAMAGKGQEQVTEGDNCVSGGNNDVGDQRGSTCRIKIRRRGGRQRNDKEYDSRARENRRDRDSNRNKRSHDDSIDCDAMTRRVENAATGGGGRRENSDSGALRGAGILLASYNGSMELEGGRSQVPQPYQKRRGGGGGGSAETIVIV